MKLLLNIIAFIMISITIVSGQSKNTVLDLPVKFDLIVKKSQIQSIPDQTVLITLEKVNRLTFDSLQSPLNEIIILMNDSLDIKSGILKSTIHFHVKNEVSQRGRIIQIDKGSYVSINNYRVRFKAKGHNAFHHWRDKETRRKDKYKKKQKRAAKKL